MVKKWWQVYEYYEEGSGKNSPHKDTIQNSLFYLLGPINRYIFIGLSGGLSENLQDKTPYENNDKDSITHYYPIGKDIDTIKRLASSMIDKWNNLKNYAVDVAGNEKSCMSHKCAPYIIRAILQGYGLFIPWDAGKLLTDTINTQHTWINEHFNNIKYYNQSICSLVQAPVQEENYNFDKINDRNNINLKYQGLYDELINNVFTDKRLPYLHYSDFIKGQKTKVTGDKSVGFGCPQYSFSYDDSCDPPSTSVKTLDADKLEVIFNPT